MLQWPLVFALVSTAIGLVYYFGPDAEHDWAWITPGAVAATALWLVSSLIFKVYVAKFTDYDAAYGSVGGVIVLLLWFYVSSLAVLIGAELNAEIEHAAAHGRSPQTTAAGRRLLGARAARSFEAQARATPALAMRQGQRPVHGEQREGSWFGVAAVAALVVLRVWRRRRIEDPSRR